MLNLRAISRADCSAVATLRYEDGEDDGDIRKMT